MKHFVKINLENIVINSTEVVEINCLDINGKHSEEVGKKFIDSASPNDWLETFVDGRRKQMAGIGFTYDRRRDIFISPCSLAGWINNENGDWVSPIEYPTDGKVYVWDNKLINWREMQ